MCYVGGSQTLCRVAAKKIKTCKLRLSKATGAISIQRKREERERARAIEREREGGRQGGGARDASAVCEKREQAHKSLSLLYHNLALPTSS